MKSFSDIPIGLFFGKTDLFVAPDDYFWLRDQLVAKNNCAYFKDYDLGHMGLVIPKEKTIFMDMLALLAKHVDVKRLRLPCELESYRAAEIEVEQIMSQIKDKSASAL